MTLELIWNATDERTSTLIEFAIQRHRTIVANIEKLSKTTFESDCGIAAMRLSKFLQEEQETISRLAALPVKNAKDAREKADYFAELLEKGGEDYDLSELSVAFKSIAEYFQPG